MLEIDGYKELPKLQQLRKINSDVNKKIRYKLDEVDYWSTAQETLTTSEGDCEDYAIVKLTMLLQLGWPVDDLRMVYSKLSIGITTEAHMVLEVNIDGVWWILDNTLNDIYKWEDRKDLTYIFSFNKNKLWTSGQLSHHNPMDRMRQWRDVVTRSEKQGYSLG